MFILRDMTTTATHKVLPLLRNATAQLHKQLDDSLPLASPRPSIEDYSRHLLGFKNWLSDIEKLTNGSHSSSEEFAAINTTALKLLEHDLQGMNADMLASSATMTKPANLSPAYCLGIEYVVKGSALGTAMLYNKVSQLFPSAPIEFMKDSMTHGKERWKKFLVKLESYDWTEDDLASAQEGSIWAFQQYITLHEMSLQNQ
jgi:heme oxygenase (biliverdin-IX-beta and delta-forming)